MNKADAMQVAMVSRQQALITAAAPFRTVAAAEAVKSAAGASADNASNKKGASSGQSMYHTRGGVGSGSFARRPARGASGKGQK